MTIGIRFRSIRMLMVSIGATVLTGCGLLEGGGASDVPSFHPEEWPWSERGEVHVRAPADDSEDLLLRFVDDDRSGVINRGAVYRFFLDDERFSVVEASEWDEADGQISGPGWRGSSSRSGFDTDRLVGGFQRLFFDEGLVPLAGGNFLNLVPLNQFPAVVVRSTAGRRSQVSLLLLFPPPTTERRDQNYHQILSTHDGSRIGPILSIPVRSEDDRVVRGPNNNYMVYYVESDEEIGFERRLRIPLVSVVRIRETLEQVFPPSVSDVPYFEPEGLGADTSAARMLIRPLLEGSDELLITELISTRSPPWCGDPFQQCAHDVGPVYKYDPGLGDFERISDPLWFGSSGAVSACRDDDEDRIASLWIDSESPPRLRFGNREVEVAGGTPIAVLPAPHSAVVAILSSDGERTPGGGTGQYFHQVFSEDTGEPVSEAVRLPRTENRDQVDSRGCWSQDERYVVYTSNKYNNSERITVVDLIAVAPGYAPFAGDCDRNGILDEEELAVGAQDCDRNGVLDECDEFFVWLSDDFELDRGWTAGEDDDARTGIWTRAEPDGEGWLVPFVDHSPLEKKLCFLTAVFPFCDDPDNCDVDDGKTTLVSPPYDLTGIPSPSIRYWRWYGNSGGVAKDDAFVVDVSADDGLTWTNVETVGPTDEEGLGIRGVWTEHAFLVSDLVEPTATVRVRFIASDTGEESFVEAAVDDFAITSPACPN